MRFSNRNYDDSALQQLDDTGRNGDFAFGNLLASSSKSSLKSPCFIARWLGLYTAVTGLISVGRIGHGSLVTRCLVCYLHPGAICGEHRPLCPTRCMLGHPQRGGGNTALGYLRALLAAWPSPARLPCRVGTSPTALARPLRSRRGIRLAVGRQLAGIHRDRLNLRRTEIRTAS